MLVVAAAEDKLNPGAVVASPSAPWVWGNEIPDLSSPSGAYHLVWSRDSYEFATALWAAGDEAAARRIGDWLFAVQQKPDGSFPQNSDVRGNPVWGELQLDEVALPIALACLVGRTGRSTWPGVRKAARFLVGFREEETGRRAPYSPQERWENQAGYSPNSIAAQVAGLVCAAHVARRHDRGGPGAGMAGARRPVAAPRRRLDGDDQRAAQRRAVLPAAHQGRPPRPRDRLRDGRRRSGPDRPATGGGPELPQPGAARAAPADDPAVANTLDVVDERLRVETPNGPFWRRFSFDGYGETRSGGEWRITETGTFETLGRGWPILTAERGEHAVSAGEDAAPYLAAVAAASGPRG